MTNIFTLDKLENFTEQINMDELYELKKTSDLNKLALFQKILNRVHSKIKITSKQKNNDNLCWFIVPEIIIGVPKYDQAGCIAYIMDKLQENGFYIRYFHPNTLLISWNHWVPSYIRNELKKKTGITVNEFGVRMFDEEENNKEIILNDGKMDKKNEIKNEKKNINSLLLNGKDNNKNSKQFTPIDSYKPIGNFKFNDT